MKIPRVLSGPDLVNAVWRRWAYKVVHQQGSHIVLETNEPTHQRIAVPAHRTLRVGTLNAILRSVARNKRVDRQEILNSLCSKPTNPRTSALLFPRIGLCVWEPLMQSCGASLDTKAWTGRRF
jgi:predicted RNA binding protein YcfA (HicA-like mRNA interferase family)